MKVSLCDVVNPQAHGMDVEQLSKPELLMLLIMLEGELEAREQVIEELKVGGPESHSQPVAGGAIGS